MELYELHILQWNAMSDQPRATVPCARVGRCAREIHPGVASRRNYYVLCLESEKHSHLIEQRAIYRVLNNIPLGYLITYYGM